MKLKQTEIMNKQTRRFIVSLIFIIVGTAMLIAHLEKLINCNGSYLNWIGLALATHTTLFGVVKLSNTL